MKLDRYTKAITFYFISMLVFTSCGNKEIADDDIILNSSVEFETFSDEAKLIKN